VRLSPHFALSEFRSPDKRHVPEAYATELQNLCIRYLEPLRERFGPVTVHSGHRSHRRNQAVGGAPLSFHLDRPGLAGAAADVSCARGGPAEWFRFLDGLGPGGLGLYPTHVHVDNRRGRARF
jgi:uncharacterized protein YcbK (DUF882 family)